MKENSGLNRIKPYYLCDIDAVLYQLSYQAILELVTLWVLNITVKGEECKWIYETTCKETTISEKNNRRLDQRFAAGAYSVIVDNFLEADFNNNSNNNNNNNFLMINFIDLIQISICKLY